LSYVIYSAVTFLFILKKKTEISNSFFTDFYCLEIKRMQWLTISFIITFLFVIITSLAKPQIFYNPFNGQNESSDIAITFFIVSFIFFNIMQSVKHEKHDSDKNQDYISAKKYERSGLKEKEAERYLNAIEEFMKNEKPYLDSDLTITSLSEKLNIPRHYLTQVINEKLKKNFFMYINEYRVNEIKKMMADDQFHDYSILRIAYQSGFNSKSGFNNAFKRFTGHTPSEYKKFLSGINNNLNI
jgi:AraC-like DNA-binding protein